MRFESESFSEMFYGINKANFVGVSLVNRDKIAHTMLLPYEILFRSKAAAVQTLND